MEFLLSGFFRRRLSSTSGIIYESATPKKVAKSERLDFENVETPRQPTFEEQEEDEEVQDESAIEIGVLEMLKQHHEDEVGGDEYGYDDYEYDDYQ